MPDYPTGGVRQVQQVRQIVGHNERARPGNVGRNRPAPVVERNVVIALVTGRSEDERCALGHVPIHAVTQHGKDVGRTPIRARRNPDGIPHSRQRGLIRQVHTV